MDISSIITDESGFINMWSDKTGNFNVKSAGQNRPKLVSTAINGNPAINFTGSNIGMVSDAKHSRSSNNPFTWLMALKSTSDDMLKHVFTTTGADWTELGVGTDYFPIAATTNGVFSYHQELKFFENETLLKDHLQIYTVRFDGSELIASMGIPDPLNAIAVDWTKEQVGHINIGKHSHDRSMDFEGFIGEILAYDIALDWNVLTNLINELSKKWTAGIQWKKSEIGKFIYFINIKYICCEFNVKVKLDFTYALYFIK